MAETKGTTNCGMSELFGLGDPKNAIKAASLTGSAIVIFSDNTSRGFGRKLEAEILAKGLGAIARSECVRNPSSGNNIEAWAWTPDYKAVQAYLNPPKSGLRTSKRG